MFSNFENDFIFGSKAETLDNLSRKLTKSEIPLFYYFSFSEWLDNKKLILEKISSLKSKEIKFFKLLLFIF